MPESPNFFRRIFSAVKRGFSLPSSIGASFFGTSGGVIMEGSPTSELPLLQVPAYTKTIRAIVRNVSQVPFVIGKWQVADKRSTVRRHWQRGFGRGFAIARPIEAARHRDAGEVWVTVPGNHPLQQLFDKPSMWLSRYSLWEAAETYLLHDGEAFYHWIGRNSPSIEKQGEIPAGIEMLSPGKMKLYPNNGPPTKWEYQSGNGPLYFEFWQVARPSYFNPYNPLRGLSLRESVALSVNSIWSAYRFNKALLENGGSPGGFLIGKTSFTKEQKSQLRESFESAFTGPTKAGRVMPIWGDVEYKPLSYDHRAMQFAELIKQAEDDIRGVYKVPEAEVSQYENTSYASSDTGRRSFWEATILPDLRLHEDSLWTGLFSVVEGGQYEGRFDLSQVPALSENKAPQLDNAAKLFAMGYPANMINEALQLGLPKIAGGDTGYLPMGLTPSGGAMGSGEPDDDTEAETEQPEETQGEQEVVVSEAAVLNGAQIQAAMDIVLAVSSGTMPRDAGIGMLIILFNLTPEQAEEIMGSAGTQTPTTPNPVGSGAPVQESADSLIRKAQSAGDMDVYWKAWVKDIFEPQEKQFESRYRRYVMDLRAYLLKRLEKVSGKKIAPEHEVRADEEPSGLTKADVDKIMFDRDEWNADLGKRMKAPISQTVGKAIKRRAKELDLPVGFLEGDEAIEKFIEKKDIKLVEQVNGTLAEHTRSQLLEGIADGETISELAARLRDVFNNATGRSLMVARTETLQSAGWATFETDKRSGVVEGKEWLTSGDEAVRDTHVKYGSLEAKPLNYEYAPGLEYPGGPNASAGESINCRCVHLPVLTGEDKQAARARAIRFALGDRA